MTNLRTYVVITATAAAFAFGQSAFAQDDLDDLLDALEGDTSAAQTKAKVEEPAPVEEIEADDEDEEEAAAEDVVPAPEPVAPEAAPLQPIIEQAYHPAAVSFGKVARIDARQGVIQAAAYFKAAAYILVFSHRFTSFHR